MNKKVYPKQWLLILAIAAIALIAAQCGVAPTEEPAPVVEEEAQPAEEEATPEEEEETAAEAEDASVETEVEEEPAVIDEARRYLETMRP